VCVCVCVSQSIRSGDLSIKKFLSLNCDLRLERRPGMVEYDDSKNAFIEMASLNPPTPRIEHGQFVPRTFDYWLVVSVLHRENWIGLPILGKQAPPNLNMKPHPDQPYP